MKFEHALFAVAVLSVAPAGHASTDIGADYGLFVGSGYIQDDNTGPSNNNSYRANVIIEQAAGGALTGGVVTVPFGGAVSGPQSLSAADDGTGDYIYQSSKYTSFSALQSAYATGSYSLSITGANDGGNPYSATLDLAATNLAGGTLPGEVPDIANTSWSGGDLLMDPTVSNTLDWSSFTDASSESSDQILFEIQNKNADTTQVFTLLPGTTTSGIIAADLLQAGQFYTVNIVFISATAAADTTDIPGSDGLVGYDNSTKFTIEAIPEPSFAALAWLGLAAVLPLPKAWRKLMSLSSAPPRPQ
jgi:hypothetical protein